VLIVPLLLWQGTILPRACNISEPDDRGISILFPTGFIRTGRTQAIRSHCQLYLAAPCIGAPFRFFRLDPDFIFQPDFSFLLDTPAERIATESLVSGGRGANSAPLRAPWQPRSVQPNSQDRGTQSAARVPPTPKSNCYTIARRLEHSAFQASSRGHGARVVAAPLRARPLGRGCALAGWNILLISEFWSSGP
jgi:hypothetical protein